jgi:hypothetical protein
MEGFQRPKTVEEITKIIENFAEQNEMAVEDLFSDVLTFAELAEAGDGTEEYLIELAGRRGEVDFLDEVSLLPG